MSSDLASRGPVPSPTQTVVMSRSAKWQRKRGKDTLRNGKTWAQKGKWNLSAAKSFHGWCGMKTCTWPGWNSPLWEPLPPSWSTPVSSHCDQSLAITVGSDKTSLAALAVLEPEQSKGGRQGGYLPEAGTAAPPPSWQQREQQACSPQHSPHVSVLCPSCL